MNRFFTLLFAASSLTAVGQGDGQCTDCLACNYLMDESCIYPPVTGQTCQGGCLGFDGNDLNSAGVEVIVGMVDDETMGVMLHVFNSLDVSLLSAVGSFILTINNEEYGILESSPTISCGSQAGLGNGSWSFEDIHNIPLDDSLWQCGLNQLTIIHVAPAISLCTPVLIWEGSFDNPLIPVDAVGVCGGDCELDWNGNGVCDDIEVFGCTYSSATNFNSLATADDGSCVFENNVNPPCGEGTAWDAVSLTCIVANPADINNDGCVQLNDLLDLLSAYGDCASEESAWQCGEPIEYQGYDYETVLIGEQCWFAENLRCTHYREGSPISEVPLADGAWESAIQGSYGFCNVDLGAHYNFLAVIDQRGLCPAGWHVPTKGEFFEIFNLVDQSVAAAHLKSTVYWDGVDSYGLNVRPAGTHRGSYCEGVDNQTRLWTSTPYDGIDAWNMYFITGSNDLPSYRNDKYHGWSVRCIRD